jgi:short-subunit dehydrogenase
MAKTALITGSTSGIGKELCKVFAQNGHDLVISARFQDQLEGLQKELEQNYNIKVIPVAADLGNVNAAQELYNAVKEKGIEVEFLVNDAGIGEEGYFYETNWEKEFHMIQLNVVSLTQLTKLFLKDMLARKSGRILNLGSIVSLIPNPKMAVYAATKAYILSLSEALATELKDTNITVTTLMPGGTDTEFFQRAHATDTKIYQDTSLDDAADVAKDGYEAMMAGSRRKISGASTKVQAALSTILPDSLMAEGMKYFMKEKDK